MFKDYYLILGIEFGASHDTIKKAYREMTLRWHPDKNHTKDATQMMYDINEAYEILSNRSTKERYDKEYEKYKQESSNIKNHIQQDFSYTYNIKDEAVKNDINEARKKAKTKVDELLREIKINLVNASKGASDEIVPWIIGIVIFLVFTFIIQTCN